MEFLLMQIIVNLIVHIVPCARKCDAPLLQMFQLLECNIHA